MEIVSVTQKLAKEGISPPELNVLKPNVENYRALLFQPDGLVCVDETGVRNHSEEVSTSQYSKFLELARQYEADIVVTPEYALPWSVLTEALTSGLIPSDGKLWALGCESIKYSKFEETRELLPDWIRLIYEPLDADDNRFLSPLVYVFNSSLADTGDKQVCVLTQFKTHPMGDPGHFEINGLQRGSSVYRFGGGANELSLTTLICADVFSFTDEHAQAIQDRGLILQIQLNENPRHEVFRGARQRLLRYKGDATEIICLNWAKDVRIRSNGTNINWNNDSVSAWYIKSRDCENSDETLVSNHKCGLYYTRYHDYRSRALFFNFDPGVFCLTATKVEHINVQGAVSRRRGPQLDRRFTWNGELADWTETLEANSGFDDIAHECGGAKDHIAAATAVNPIIVERLLALSVGSIEPNEEWYRVDMLDSFQIGPSETINRITFCQDRCESAKTFRTGRLKKLARLWSAMIAGNVLPKVLSDIDVNSRLDWNAATPHQNIQADSGQKATVVYLGEDADSSRIQKVYTRIDDFLRRSISEEQKCRLARQRLVVLYPDENGQVIPYGHHEHIRIDESGESGIDIGRED